MDRYRVVGPQTSTPPITRSAENAAEALPRKRQAQRADGRVLDDLRPVFLKTRLISQANGSAYIEMKNTKISCGVYGPRQTKTKLGFSGKGMLNCEFKFSTFACRKRRGFMRDARERDFSSIVCEALAPSVRLDLLPKSSIDVYINVLEADGMASCLAAAITCASVALADAGIEMLDLVAACSASVIDNHVYLDCSEDEERAQGASVMVSYMPSLDEATHVLMSGELETGLMQRATEQVLDACATVYAVMNAALIWEVSTTDEPGDV